MIGYNGFVDLFRNLQKQGIAELQMKGFTAEEEDREVMAFFMEIANDIGYPHIHTLTSVLGRIFLKWPVLPRALYLADSYRLSYV